MMDWLTNNSGIIVTVGFSVMFVAIALWVYWPSNKRSMEDQAKIPFKEQSDD